MKKNQAILMEDYFTPGFKTKPAVHVGSQTHRLLSGNAEEQAWEGCYLAAASKDDLVVLRNFDQDYLDYWKSLIGKPYVLNIKTNDDLGEYLTDVILKNKEIIDLIKANMHPKSRLMVFLPTELEEQLAQKLGIRHHGSPKINELYGTKSGIRRFAQEVGLKMAPGFICTTYLGVEKAIKTLSKSFETIVIKHDTSMTGYFSKKLQTKKINNLKEHLNEVSGGKFVEGKDVVVVEGWLKNKASLCAHIEILEGQEPIICGGWQQIIDSDGVTYMGAGPLTLSNKAMKSFIQQVKKFAYALQEKGAIGSYGPDFLIVDKGQKGIEEDTSVLIELNARVPYTAFPLEIIKQIKGKIGAGFLSRHIRLNRKMKFLEIRQLLEKEGLLITSKAKNAKGVVPYNVGLLPWKLFDIVIMAESLKETLKISKKIDYLFRKNLN